MGGLNVHYSAVRRDIKSTKLCKDVPVSCVRPSVLSLLVGLCAGNWLEGTPSISEVPIVSAARPVSFSFSHVDQFKKIIHTFAWNT